MTLSVTTGSSVAVSVTLATTTDTEAQTFDSYSTEQTLLYAAESDPSALAMVLGGESVAVGEETLAAASMTVELDGTGPVGTADGNATFVAVANSAGDESAFATAGSFGALSGADVLVVLTSHTEIIDQGPDESIAVATSAIALYGLDFDSTIANESPETDPTLDPPAEGQVPGITDLAISDQGYLDLGSDIEGNVAILDVTAEVVGANTFVEAAASVLTVADTLSIVTGEIVAAVG